MLQAGCSEAVAMLPTPHRRRFVLTAWCVLAVLASLGISGALAQTSTQVVVDGTGGDGLNVRSEPDVLASVVTVAPEGARLTTTGPEISSGGRRWRPVVTDGGVPGWAAADFLVPVPGATTAATATPMVPAAAAIPPPDAMPTMAPTLAPTATPTPGPPLDLEIRFKVPEIDARDEQTIYVDVFRGTVPQPGVEVLFTVVDEDPEIERIASLTNRAGRSTFSWHVRRYRGTTEVRVRAVAPDRGEGKATGSFFVR